MRDRGWAKILPRTTVLLGPTGTDRLPATSATRSITTKSLLTICLASVCMLCLEGCVAPASLDSAGAVIIASATPADIARRTQAERGWWKSLFRGGSIRDPQRGLLTFKTGEYDAFEAEEKQLSSLVSSRVGRQSSGPNWPVLRIGFALRSLPISPDTTGTSAEVILYLCDSENPLRSSVGRSELMWNGLYVTANNANQIQQAINMTGEPQSYEVILPYIHVKWSKFPDDTGEIIPPERDLCLARFQSGLSFVAGIGRPLRLDRDIVRAVLATLPRELRKGGAGISP